MEKYGYGNNNYGNGTPVGTGYQRQVTFGEAIKSAFSKYCCFSGRASRSEYWYFVLFSFLVSVAVACTGSETLSTLVSLVFLLPSLGLSWRRMHDIGKGGGWYFIILIPLVGIILWIVWCCKESEMYTNRFGPVPNWVE